MTINARKDNRRGRRYRVKLDGVLRPHCFYADGRRGVVREYVSDGRGNVALFTTGGERGPATRELRGKVEWVRIA